MMIKFYDKDANEISWDEYFEILVADGPDVDVRRIGLDTVDPYEISTVWTGMSFDDPPKPFETMISSQHTGESVCFLSWETLAKAQEGHEALVRSYEYLENFVSK